MILMIKAFKSIFFCLAMLIIDVISLILEPFILVHRIYKYTGLYNIQYLLTGLWCTGLGFTILRYTRPALYNKISIYKMEINFDLNDIFMAGCNWMERLINEHSWIVNNKGLSCVVAFLLLIIFIQLFTIIYFVAVDFTISIPITIIAVIAVIIMVYKHIDDGDYDKMDTIIYFELCKSDIVDPLLEILQIIILIPYFIPIFNIIWYIIRRKICKIDDFF